VCKAIVCTWRIGRKRGTYELVAHESYVVIYRVLAKDVEILRIKHTAQQWSTA